MRSKFITGVLGLLTALLLVGAPVAAAQDGPSGRDDAAKAQYEVVTPPAEPPRAEAPAAVAPAAPAPAAPVTEAPAGGVLDVPDEGGPADEADEGAPSDDAGEPAPDEQPVAAGSLPFTGWASLTVLGLGLILLVAGAAIRPRRRGSVES